MRSLLDAFKRVATEGHPYKTFPIIARMAALAQHISKRNKNAPTLQICTRRLRHTPL
jgi:hypothetical protein